MTSPTTIIAEDEPLLRGALREALAKLWPELEILAEAEDGIQAIHALHTHQPDILFLDIEMPGLNGLDVARAASGRCHVVFVTAYNEHAVAAFEQGAVDYVMKPFSTARLAAAVGRLRDRLHSRPARLDGLIETIARPAPSKKYLQWLNVSQGAETRLVTTDEIVYFRSDNKYTVVATVDKEALVRVTIRELSEQLDPAVFWQIHRGTLVNVSYIAGVTRDFRGRMALRLKRRPETLPVSDSYTHLFRQM